MTKVTIFPVMTDRNQHAYHAIAGSNHAAGATAGAALDALTPQLAKDERTTLIIIQHFRPDRFFSQQQQQRLAALMSQWRLARDGGSALTLAEQNELEGLIEAEIQAAAQRAAAIADDISL